MLAEVSSQTGLVIASEVSLFLFLGGSKVTAATAAAATATATNLRKNRHVFGPI